MSQILSQIEINELIRGGTSREDEAERIPKIQFMRTKSDKQDEVILKPGEPLLVLDTGKLYIGLENGKRVCINP